MRPDHDADRSVSLSTLIEFLVAFGGGLFLTVGLPHAPTQPVELPDPASLEALLRSPHPPLNGAIYIAGMLGWAIWAWLVLSLVLQVGAVIGQRVAAGTAVVQRASSLADLLSAPIIRNAVRTSLAGGMMARVALAGVPAAAASPVDRPALVVSISPRTSSAQDHAPHFRARSDDATSDVPAGAIVYTVQPGDNLVRIAERFYDDGDKWQLLYETNQGRQMADGRSFDRAGVIQPGWQLVVPEPTTAIETDADGQRWYTVHHGDSLAGISARLLGDETRWRELYAANAGARLDETHVLHDPRLIWPGLRLQLPEDGAPDAQANAGSDAPLKAEPVPEVSGAQDGAPAAATPVIPPQVTAVSSNATAAANDLTAQGVQAPAATPTIVATRAPLSSRLTTVASNDSAGASRAAGAAAGAGLALVGIAGTTLALGRRWRRPPHSQEESDATVRAGFAEAETEDPSSDGASDELTTAATIASRLSWAVAAEILGRNGAGHGDLPVDGTQLVGVRHGRSSTTLLLQMPIASRAFLIGCLRDAATRAFGRKSDIEAVVSRDGDVVIRLSPFAHQLDLSEPQDEHGAEAWPGPSMLLRLGLLADRQLFAANWDALSHVLVAAPLSQSAEAVLGGLITSLVARRSPSQLGFVVLGAPRCLPEELIGLPHRLEPVIDPQDESGALHLLNCVRRELEERVASGATDAPDLLVVVPELAELSAEQQVALGPVMLHGPLHRVRVVAASARRAVDLVQSCSLVPEFGTRLVLRVTDDEESTVLLGSSDATELGPGGHLLARLEGRVPLQAYGYRVDADCLARLAAAIASKGIAAEWWDKGGGSLEQSTQEPEEPTEVSDDHPLEHGEQEVRANASGEDEDSPTGLRGAAFVANVDEADTAQLEPPGPLTAGANVASLPSAMPEAPFAETTENGTGRAREVPPAPVPSGENAESAATAGQLWSSATQPRPPLRGRFLGARELIYDGRVVWPVPGQADERAMELLVYLGVQDPSGVRAELLGDSLWSEDDDDESRTERLRKRRYRMRQALKKLVPELEGNPIAPIDKKNPVYRLNSSVIESDVHRFLKLVQEAKSLPPESACAAYEAALDLYGGDLLDRPDVPPYRWMDEGPRLVDLRVKYAAIEHQARRRLADLLAAGPEDGLARAEELYIGLAEDDPLDHRLWEALARLHERRNDVLGLEASMRRLRSALVELGEGDDLEHVIVPPALERVFSEVRAALLRGRAA